MKKLFTFILLLLGVVQSTYAKEPYAVLSAGNKILTFYYDNNKATRGGMDVGPFFNPSDVGWYEQTGNITTVVFDKSFSDCSTISSTTLWFCYCTKLTAIQNIEYLNTSNVTDMSNMFAHCSSLKNIDVSNFNTANVTDLGCMFNGCSSLTNLDVSNFNTDNVTNMYEMFSDCSSLKSLDVRNFNTTNVTNMYEMFSGCSNLTTIICDDDWNPGGTNLFDGCTSLKGAISYKDGNGYMANPVDGYFTSYAYAVLSSDNTLTLYYDDNKTNRGGMAIRLNGNYGWSDQCMNIKKVVFDASFAKFRYLRNMRYWFDGCSELKDIEGLEYLNTSNVTSMWRLFAGCSSLTSLDLRNFDTRNLTETTGMFDGCCNLRNLDVSNFNTGKVTVMWGMFHGCSSLTSLDVSNFNTEMVEQMNEMFYECSNLSTIYCNDTWNCESSSDMFYGCKALQGAVSYDFNKNDVNYANPTTGYFTAVKPGDANADKTINIEDAVVVAKRIMGEKTEKYVFVGADANCDKKVNVADIVKITNM